MTRLALALAGTALATPALAPPLASAPSLSVTTPVGDTLRGAADLLNAAPRSGEAHRAKRGGGAVGREASALMETPLHRDAVPLPASREELAALTAAPPRLRALAPAAARLAAASLSPEIDAPSTEYVVERGKGLVLRLPRPAASIFVADPAIADFQARSPGQLYLFGKAPGETVLYAVDAANRTIVAATVRVIQPVGPARAALARHLPGEPVEIAAIGGALVLTGSVSTAVAAADAVAIAAQFVGRPEAVVNRLGVRAPAQVNLRVRIAEVNRTVLKQIGVNWQALVESGRFALAAATQNPVTFPELLNRNAAAVTVGDVTATIDALAQDGLITLLAQPNLVATSGETASFLAGGEFPVPIAVDRSGGVPTITIEFKKFGIALEFTPTVLDAGRIAMRVRPEVSQLSNTGAIQQQGFSIPSLTVRRAETTVELGSGETFVIAGLLQRTSEQSLTKLPGLGDIPVLGALFRSNRYRRGETELAIIVTPYLVRPVPSARAALAPTDGLVQPDDARQVLGGQLWRRADPPPPSAPPPGDRR